MASNSILHAPLQRLLHNHPPTRSILSPLSQCRPTSPPPVLRTFSTTPSPSARTSEKKSSSKRSGKGQPPQQDPKIVSMRKHLHLLSPRLIPPPLRMARNRHLRHWTIHRAWLLFRRQQREAHERELMRMFQGMSLACEELRVTDGPGTREEGYLYRVAMEKKGVYGHSGVPIEYARMQTETPAREAWNHGWKRGV